MADGEVWTINWPAGFRPKFVPDHSAQLVGPSGVVAEAGDRITVSGFQGGMPSTCMLGSHFEATAIVSVDHLVDESDEYAAGELLVQFRNRPSARELEAFGQAHGLSIDHRLFGALYLFRVVDGTDAWEKRLVVGSDALIRSVSLNWHGSFFP